MLRELKAAAGGFGVLVLFGLTGCSPRETVEEEAARRYNELMDNAVATIANDPQFDGERNQIRGMINLNNHSCNQVLLVRPLPATPNTFEVTCIDDRGEGGRSRYRVNLNSQTVARL